MARICPSKIREPSYPREEQVYRAWKSWTRGEPNKTQGDDLKVETSADSRGYTIRLRSGGTRREQTQGRACHSMGDNTDSAGDGEAVDRTLDRHRDGVGPAESHWDIPPAGVGAPQIAFCRVPVPCRHATETSN
jgi:hypothetical protein